MIFNYKLSLVLQIVEESQPQLTSQYFENSFILLCSLLIIATVMLIPVIISFLMLDYIIKIKKLDNKFDRSECSENNIYNSKQIKCLCQKYTDYFSSFTQYLVAIITWNVLSLVYVLTAFPDFLTGVNHYFKLPFNTLQIIYYEGLQNAVNDYAINWYYMLAISLLSLFSLYPGSYIGIYLGRWNLQKREIEAA